MTDRLIPLSFGAVLTIAGAAWGLKRWRLRRGGTRTTGMVVEITTNLVRPKTAYPVVELTTDAGVKIRFRGSTGSEGGSSYSLGQTVKVIYPRQQPGNALIDDFEQFWLGPACIGLFGLIVLGVAVFVVR